MVHYQPQVDVRTGRIVSAESLVRWEDPAKGLLAPGSFIPLAAETGMISAIDLWVLSAACRQARAWLDAGCAALRVTVNLSARSFQDPGLVPKISKILDGAGFPAERLVLEITEAMAMCNVEQTSERIGELARMGMRISIDDFGTGYSSITCLKRLPVGWLKIDRSFVKDVPADPGDKAIITALTAMAHGLGMKVAAEGVETADQVEFLRGAGCDEMQGYLISRPLPAGEFAKLLSDGKTSVCPGVG